MKYYLKISHYLQATFKILSFAVLVFIILLWSFVDILPTEISGMFNFSYFTNNSTPGGAVNLLTMQHSTISKLICFIGSLIGSLPYILAYYTLHKLFANYAKGKIFIHENVSIYQRLGRILFMNGLLCIPLHDSLMVLAATINNAPGQRMLNISFGTPNLEAILLGFVIMVIAWVMQQASDLNNEQQLTV